MSQAGDTSVAVTRVRRWVRPELFAPLTSLAVVALLLIVGGLLAPGFLTLSHVLLLLALSAFLGVVGIGETIVILTGGIDLSIAWVITTAGVIFTGTTLGQTSHLAAGLAAALGIGLAAGLVNGLGVAKLKISPIVMTLAMNNIMQGVALLYTQGTPTGGTPPAIKTLVTGSLGPMPLIVLFWLLLGVIAVIGLRFTRGGRALYGMGENPVVSRLSGIRNDRVIILAYALCGFSAAITGILYAGFSGASFLGMGDQFVLPAIAAVVLGGTSILGGRGSYLGTIIGAFFLTVLTTVLSIVNLSAGVRNIIYGLVIIGAVLLHRAYSGREP